MEIHAVYVYGPTMYACNDNNLITIVLRLCTAILGCVVSTIIGLLRKGVCYTIRSVLVCMIATITYRIRSDLNVPYGNTCMYVAACNITRGVLTESACMTLGNSDTFPGICVVCNTLCTTTNMTCNFILLMYYIPGRYYVVSNSAFSHSD